MRFHQIIFLTFCCLASTSLDLPAWADSAAADAVSKLPPGPAQSAADHVLDADRAFAAGDFTAAVSGYIQAQQQGANNGYLEYNLGNAYFRTGDIGRAILHLRRGALKLGISPEIEGNLRFIRNIVKDPVPETCPSGSAPSPFDGSGFGISPDAAMWSTIASWLIFWTLFGYGSFNSAVIFRFLTGAAFFASFVGGLLIFLTIPGNNGGPCLRWGLEAGNYHPVVVIDPQVEVRSGAAPDSQLVLIMHQGTELLAGEVKAGFVQIFLPGGRTGFVPQSAIESV